MRTARPLALLLLTARAASSDAPASLADARPDDPRLRQLLSPYEQDGVVYSYSFVDPAYETFNDPGAYCSGMNLLAGGSYSSIAECYEGCVNRYPNTTIISADFWPEYGVTDEGSSGCWCHDSCDCMQEWPAGDVSSSEVLTL